MAGNIPQIEETKDSEALQAYLETRPLEEAQIVVMRAGLRVMPLVVEKALTLSDENFRDYHKRVLIAACFRSLLISWFARKYPNQDMSAAARAAALAAARAADSAADSDSALAARAAALAAASSADSALAASAVDAAFAASALAASAASALAASAASAAAADAIWFSIQDDLTALNDGEVLVDAPLWSSSVAAPEVLTAQERKFRQVLSDWGEEWVLIYKWYEDVKAGRRIFGFSRAVEEGFAFDVGLQPNDFWDEPDKAMVAIAEKLRAMREAEAPPALPEQGPGPHYKELEGKLHLVAAPPSDTSSAIQEKLLESLRGSMSELKEMAHRVGNRHSALANTINEYAALIESPIEELDVVSLWSVGGVLAGYAQAFREQNIERTLADPLEPEFDGLLQGAVRKHGAFIMGFEEGRELVERADTFALDTERLRRIAPVGDQVLGVLSNYKDLVDEFTRKSHAVLRDFLQEYGWEAGRAGYSGYLTVRNSTRAIIKYAVGENPTLGSIVGLLVGGSILLGDRNLEFVRAALPFLRDYGSQLSVFFSHSPEMRAYVEWAVKLVDDAYKETEEREKRNKNDGKT